MKTTPLRSILVTAAVVAVTACASGQSRSQATDESSAPREMRGARPGMPDLSGAAAKLGVSEEALREAMRDAGGPPPDMEQVAAQLGVSVEALTDAMPAPRRRP